MRFAILVLAAVSIGTAAEPIKRQVELESDIVGILGLPLAESTEPVYRIRLAATVDETGEGEGVLTLDPTGLPTYDEFGFPGDTPAAAVINLDCKIKRLKRTVKTYTSHRLGAPEDEAIEHKQDWRLYSITGPKVTSRLFLAMDQSKQWVDGRFLVKGNNDKVKYMVGLHEPPQIPLEPCHPGCFPAGTLIAVPKGTKAIEDICAGDIVITVSADGVFGEAKVASVFVTRNRLIEVQTADGILTTTATQPLSLASGELEAAGKLQAGDRIYKSDGLNRQEVIVRAVMPTDREAKVFNLILNDSVLFLADKFLARSKPPKADENLVQP